MIVTVGYWCVDVGGDSTIPLLDESYEAEILFGFEVGSILNPCKVLFKKLSRDQF